MSGTIRPRTVAGMLLVASLSVACAARATSPPGQSPATNGLVLRVDTRGGFLAPVAAVTRVPQFSLFADGLVVVEGAQIEIYPGPATPPVFSMKVSEDGIRKIIEAARRAGLDGLDRTYRNPVAGDVGTTTFTFIDKGKVHTISVAGLGFEPSDPSIPPDERKARSALQQLDAKLGNLSASLPSDSVSREQPFEYQRLAVIVSTQPPGEQLEQLEQRELTWPLDRTIAELAKPVAGAPQVSCAVVGGEGLAKLRPLVGKANDLTPWKSGGRTFWLRFRPLLPDESGCPHA